MNKVKQIIKELNKTKKVDIKDSDRERIVFDNDGLTFEIFEDVLDPFNDSTYRFLSDFLTSLEYREVEHIEDLNALIDDSVLYEISDETVDVYNHDLLEWVSDNTNYVYVDELSDEDKTQSFFNMLRSAQYNHRVEIYSTALNILIEYIEEVLADEEEQEELNEVVVKQ